MTIETEAQRFFTAATAAFQYLITEYGYSVPECGVVGPDQVRSARAHVRFGGAGKRVVVEVALTFGDPILNVGLIESSNGAYSEHHSYWADAGYSRAISLETLALIASEGEYEPTMPVHTPYTSIRGIGAMMNERSVRIEADMEGLIGQLAQCLRTYAQPELSGSLARFDETIVRHRKLYRDRD